jgi:molybdopterin synthase sulfur carrier subunit
MQIHVRYFASVREALGELDTLSWPDAGAAPANVGALRDWLQTRSPEHARVLDPARGLRAALNQAFCHDDDALADGDEVAFFPPVTGG